MQPTNFFWCQVWRYLFNWNGAKCWMVRKAKHLMIQECTCVLCLCY